MTTEASELGKKNNNNNGKKKRTTISFFSVVVVVVVVVAHVVGQKKSTPVASSEVSALSFGSPCPCHHVYKFKNEKTKKTLRVQRLTSSILD